MLSFSCQTAKNGWVLTVYKPGTRAPDELYVARTKLELIDILTNLVQKEEKETPTC